MSVSSLYNAVLRRLWTAWGGVVVRRVAAASALAVACAGCLSDAEHSNPLDPNSVGFEAEGVVEGVTTRYYPPHSPVDGAEVRLTPGPYVVESGADGRFVFEDIPVGTYTITAAKEGFATMADTVKVDIGSVTTDVRLRLDGVPIISTYELRTVHVSRWWPEEDLYFLEIVVEVDDPDGIGDVSAVWIEIPLFDFAQPLDEAGTVGTYFLLLPAASLPAPSLHSLEGMGLVLHVQDEAGFVTESEPRSIVRVIDEIPLAVEPQGLISIDDGRPNLTWEDAGLPFAFSYRIDVVRDQANVQTVVETITGIPSDSTSHQLEAPLSPGTYFWTVSVVDTFGNRSRSKEAGFVVP